MSNVELTDVKTLRERARQHVEQGAVTEGYHADRQELWSKSARLAFPIRDGIPVMLVGEARELSDLEVKS